MWVEDIQYIHPGLYSTKGGKTQGNISNLYLSLVCPGKSREEYCLLRADKESTLWPGDFVEVKVENDFLKKSEVAIEPRISPDSHSWVTVQLGLQIILVNLTQLRNTTILVL